MANDNENGGGEQRESQWRGRAKRRDDTPSFIRNVQARADMLNPNRASEEFIPVLAMPASVRIWRRVRWPLFIVIVVAILATVGFFTNNILVARSVERTISEARAAESLGTIEQFGIAHEQLSALAERHRDRSNAQVAWAWHSLVEARLFGPEKTLVAQGKEALARVPGDDSPVGIAARAALALLEGEPTAALELADKGLESGRDEPRLAMVRAWALADQGNLEKARETVAAARKVTPSYLPLLATGISLALATDDRLTALSLAEETLDLAPGQLHATLTTVAVRLPRWGEPRPEENRIAALLKDVSSQRERIQTAPPKLGIRGRYLTGRVQLLAGQHQQAVESLKYAAERVPDDEVFAWYARAINQNNGPEAALQQLGTRPDVVTAEVLELRAECLIGQYKVDAASAAVEQLKSEAGLTGRVQALAWRLAVRKGDLQQALDLLPEQLEAADVWIALEMYHQLANVGDHEAIERLRGSLSGNLAPCATAIETWHGNSSAKVMAMLESDGSSPCVDALVGEVLRRHGPPDKLKQIAERAAAASDGNLSLEINRALAVWLVDGQAAALQLLDAVAARQPEGTPLRVKLARAYTELGAFDKGQALLGEDEHPEALAVRVDIARAKGEKGKAAKLIARAAALSKDDQHPALAYLASEHELAGGSYQLVIDRAEERMRTGGAWTAEIIELGARALSAVGDRGEADRLLTRAARPARVAAGLAEAWQTSLAIMRLNLKRGGRFVFKAVSVVSGMTAAGIKDPELSYGYAMAHIDQGNERGSLRFLRESVDLDPGFVPSYAQLATMDKLGDDLRARLEKVRPGTKL